MIFLQQIKVYLNALKEALHVTMKGFPSYVVFSWIFVTAAVYNLRLLIASMKTLKLQWNQLLGITIVQ